MGTANEVKYVAGFLFNDERSAVALIHKTHGPACMVGKWNAIGGKRTPGQPGLPDESSDAAMWREFLEEAGVSVTSWRLFLRLKGPGWSVDFFHAFSSDALAQVRTCEGETVQVFHLTALPETVPNLRWIMPMALGHEDDHVWVYEVIEKETFAPRQADPVRSHQPVRFVTEPETSAVIEVRRLLGGLAGYFALQPGQGAQERLRQINDWFARFPSPDSDVAEHSEIRSEA